MSEAPPVEETSRRTGTFSNKLAKSALALAILSGGACQDNQTSGDVAQAEVVAIPETTIDQNIELIEELSDRLEQQQQEIDNMSDELDYVGSLTGMSPSEIERHLSFPTIERIAQPINPELAKKQDAATMYVLSYDTAFPYDDTARLMFSCTAVKTEDNRLTSAAHCFDQAVFADYGQDPISGGMGKGGGGMPEFDSYASSISYFVADRNAINHLEPNKA